MKWYSGVTSLPFHACEGAGERNLNHISWEEESLDDVEIACFASLMRECVSLLNLQCPTQTPVCVNSTLNS